MDKLAAGDLGCGLVRFDTQNLQGARQHAHRPPELIEVYVLIRRVVRRRVPRTVCDDGATPRRAEEVLVRGACLELESRLTALGSDRSQQRRTGGVFFPTLIAG